ncbi:hypothetical protein HZS_6307 [Henneguya salminicola]|nr:hypothetical protein HZS_6307 [Henneguya salminicola]
MRSCFDFRDTDLDKIQSRRLKLDSEPISLIFDRIWDLKSFNWENILEKNCSDSFFWKHS